MPAIITVEEAQANLKEIIHQLSPGEELVITEHAQPVAKLVSEEATRVQRSRPGPGVCKGEILYMAGFRRAAGRNEGLHGMKLLLDTHAFLWHSEGNPLALSNMLSVAALLVSSPTSIF